MSKNKRIINRFSIRVNVTHLYQEAARVFSRQVGMSLSRIEVLHELMHAGEISQKELQERLRMEGSLLTRFVKQIRLALKVGLRPQS